MSWLGMMNELVGRVLIVNCRGGSDKTTASSFLVLMISSDEFFCACHYINLQLYNYNGLCCSSNMYTCS